MDLLHLVDRLEELIAEAQKMPIGNRVIIDRRRLLDLIDQMRISVPQEVRDARDIVTNRDRVLRDAEEEARILIARAEESASTLVEAHQITEAAKERAQEIADEAEHRLTQRVAQANQDIQVRIEESRNLARQQMQAADDYALELLRRLDRQLQAFVGSVQSGIQQVEPERELPPAPYPGEFDPGPPAPGNFRSDDALGSLPADERQADDLTIARHQLPETPVPEITLAEPEPIIEEEPAPVVMAEDEPAPPAPVIEEPSPVEQADLEPAPPSSLGSRFGASIWGRSAEPEPPTQPETPPAAEESPAEAPSSRSSFASSIWGRPSAPAEEAEEPAAEIEPEEILETSEEPADAPEEPAALFTSAEQNDEPEETAEASEEISAEEEQPPADSDELDEVEPAETAPEPAPASGGGGPFSSLFSRPAAEGPPPAAPSTGSSAAEPTSSQRTNLPGESGRLPGAGSVPPPSTSRSRLGLFGRGDRPAASVEADVAPTAESADSNGETVEETTAASPTPPQPATDDRRPPSGFGAGLGRASAGNGDFEDLLAQARATAEPISDSLREELAEESAVPADDLDEPAAIIDDFDNPPLDDDPIHSVDVFEDEDEDEHAGSTDNLN